MVKRGAAEAGAAFVMTRERLGDVSLFGPAPQTSYDTGKPDERIFSPSVESGDAGAVEKYLEREQRFDPDIWVIEIEPGSVLLEDLILIHR